MSPLEIVAVIWIAVGIAYFSWRGLARIAERRRGNTLGYIDRFVVPEETRSIVHRLREQERG